MKLSTLRTRSAATALVLSVAVLGAACADSEDASSVGQEESTETESTDAESTDAAEGTEAPADDEAGSTEAPADGKTGKVGAKYAANVFTLVATDETEDGRIVAITDGSVDVRTSNTISYTGEVVDFTDPKVAETLGEDAYEALETDLAQQQVLLIETYSVQ